MPARLHTTAGGSSNEEHRLGRSAEKYASVTPSQRNDEKLNTIDDTGKENKSKIIILVVGKTLAF